MHVAERNVGRQGGAAPGAARGRECRHKELTCQGGQVAHVPPSVGPGRGLRTNRVSKAIPPR